jgi:hypothetical protein
MRPLNRVPPHAGGEERGKRYWEFEMRGWDMNTRRRFVFLPLWCLQFHTPRVLGAGAKALRSDGPNFRTASNISSKAMQ